MLKSSAHSWLGWFFPCQVVGIITYAQYKFFIREMFYHVFLPLFLFLEQYALKNSFDEIQFIPLLLQCSDCMFDLEKKKNKTNAIPKDTQICIMFFFNSFMPLK